MDLREPNATSEAFLRRVVADSPHEKVRAWSTYALSMQLMQQSEMADRIGSMPAGQVKGFRSYFGDETVDAILGREAKDRAAEIESLLATICETLDESDYESLVGMAKGDLFEARNLAIGKIAPEIEGEDLDGVAFKLSDYRGKVVVLDFWGNW